MFISSQEKALQPQVVPDNIEIKYQRDHMQNTSGGSLRRRDDGDGEKSAGLAFRETMIQSRFVASRSWQWFLELGLIN